MIEYLIFFAKSMLGSNTYSPILIKWVLTFIKALYILYLGELSRGYHRYCLLMLTLINYLWFAMFRFRSTS